MGCTVEKISCTFPSRLLHVDPMLHHGVFWLLEFSCYLSFAIEWLQDQAAAFFLPDRHSQSAEKGHRQSAPAQAEVAQLQYQDSCGRRLISFSQSSEFHLSMGKPLDIGFPYHHSRQDPTQRAVVSTMSFFPETKTLFVCADHFYS